MVCGAGEEGESAATRRSRGSLALAGAGVLAAVLVLVAATSRHEMVRSASALLASEGASAAVGLGVRAGAELQLTRLWDEDAVGNALDAEINVVKKQFMQQQLQAHTTNFGLPSSTFHPTTALQEAANATADANVTTGNTTAANATDTSPLIAFDNEWFAHW